MSPTPPLPEGIERLPISVWENGHQNFTHTFKKDASFKLRVPDSATPYQDTTKNFQWLIRYATDHNIQLRAMGNGWSFSEVAVCEGGLVDTKALRLSYALRDSFVAQDYLDSGGRSDDLFFVQCGMSVLQLNEKLETSNPKRSLKASGASNGQTIAGCTATGTHGAAFEVGAVHDTIVGLHIVTGADRHVWLERRSKPVASDAFIEWLGAEAVKDDDLFNAAVVSFGSFGFIHGVLLETEPVFLLEQRNSGSIAYDEAVKKAMNELDMSGILAQIGGVPEEPDKKLYHFQVVVNPFQFEPGNPDKGIYLKTMYKVPYYTGYPHPPADDKGFTYGDDTLGVIEKILDTLGNNLSALLVPALVNKMFPLAFNADGIRIGTVGETFNNTKFRGKAASVAIGIDSSYASRVLEEIIAINRQMPFPGGVALRYVKGTAALLGFTRFDKTCVLELDGVEAEVSRNFFRKVWSRLEELDIPYTLHWGKLNFDLNPALVRKMYGGATVDKWIACRKALLSPAAQKVFTNAFMVQCGLDA